MYLTMQHTFDMGYMEEINQECFIGDNIHQTVVKSFFHHTSAF